MKIHNLAVLGILTILVCSLLGYLGRFNYLLDLTNHFHVYYWLGALILLAFFLFTKKWRWIGVALICLILNSVVLYPWTVESLQDNDPDPDGWASIKLVQSNVEYDNTKYDELISYVNEASPDVLVLQEINNDWMPHLSALPDEIGVGGCIVTKSITCSPTLNCAYKLNRQPAQRSSVSTFSKGILL